MLKVLDLLPDIFRKKIHRNSSLVEYIALLINRGAAPGAMFLAISVFSRILEKEVFTNFLLIYSSSQWIVAFAYQWQKNCVVRYFDSAEYKRIAIPILAATSGAIFTASLLLARYYKDHFSLAAGMYVIAVGLTYFFGATSRMSGRIHTYTTTDTVSHISRWALAIGAGLLFLETNYIFLTLSFSLIIPIIILAKATIWNPVSSHHFDLRTFVQAAGSMAVFDFSASTLMYADRIYSKDADYILYSTIGSQVANIILGSYVSAAYPRISLVNIDGGDWQKTHMKFLKRLPVLAITTSLLLVIAGPLLLRIVSPATPPNTTLIAVHALCQTMHFIVVVCGIAFIMKNNNWVVSAIYASTAAMYILIINIFTIHNHYILIILRLVFLVILAILILVMTRAIYKGSKA